MLDALRQEAILPLLGGTLIGLAAAAFVLVNGRIAGISGIAAGLVRARRGDRSWRMAFLAGLLLAPCLAGVWHALPAPALVAGTPVMALAGLLVGIGTRLAGGCTSGHGVCGIARGSPRSLAATATFVAAAMVTATLADLLRRHLA
jgi:uncharacterized membrane protein YedE/YeeE